MSIVLAKPRFIPADEMEITINDHLHASGMFPSTDDPVLDIEAFLEQYLKAEMDQYCLSLAAGELGVTEFRPGEQPRVKISRALTENADAANRIWEIGRWRFTLAHEAAHILLHRTEIEAAFSQGSLFDAETPSFCLPAFRDDQYPSAKCDPREYQANFSASVLLMPRALFLGVAQPLVRSIQTFTAEDFMASPAYDTVLREVAQRFRVSKTAARIRFETLGLAALRGQTVMSH